MSTIEDLERKVQSLRDQLSAAEKSLTLAKLDAAPVHVGDVVISKRYGECLVRGVNVKFSGRPWVQGSPRKKDGEFSAAWRYLYGDWELRR